MGADRYSSNKLSELLCRGIAAQANYTRKAAPFPVPCERYESLACVCLNLAPILKPHTACVKPQDPQPFCHLSEHAINYKTLFRGVLIIHLISSRLTLRAFAGKTASKMDTVKSLEAVI